MEDCREQLDAIARHLNDDTALYVSVETLTTYLVMGYENYLRKFNVADALPLLLQIIECRITNNDQGDMMTIAFRALSLIMEHVPSGLEQGRPFLTRTAHLTFKVIHKAVNKEWRYHLMSGRMLQEECLRTIKFTAKDDITGTILQHIPVSDLFALCTDANLVTACQALEALLMICTKVILPSQVETPTFPLSAFLSIFKSKRKQKAVVQARILHENHPLVVQVENVVGPFLHNLLSELSGCYATAPEMWVSINLVLQCIGTLAQRALLCHRYVTAKRLVSQDFIRLIFRLISISRGNPALDASTTSKRMLTCETVLAVAAVCNSNALMSVLTDKDAKSFFKGLMQTIQTELTSLIDEPFPHDMVSARSTQRRDKDLIVTIAAIHLFVLVCPKVPHTAFGLKPKVVLPVHEWTWEDGFRRYSNFTEDQCLVLETNWSRLSTETRILVQMKPMHVNLQSMTISKAPNSGFRNISRRFVPFIYHFVDEVKVKTEAQENELASGADLSTPMAQGERGKDKQSVKRTLMHDPIRVPPAHVSVAEAYFELLCAFATHSSGQMARQVAICACASMLQMMFLSDAVERVGKLMGRVMLQLCEMFRESLRAADKSTKAVVLTMMEWILHHPIAAALDFCDRSLCCGLLNQLYISSVTTVGVTVANSRPTRTAYLTIKCATIYQEIVARLHKKHGSASLSGLLFMRPEMSRLNFAVEELRSVVVVEGVHQVKVRGLMEVLKVATGVTSYEVWRSRLASTILEYLLGEKAMCSLTSRQPVVFSSSGSASTRTSGVVGRPSTGGTPLESTSSRSITTLEGLSFTDWMIQMSDAARMRTFAECAEACPKGLHFLIKHLVSTLPIQANFPLVESVVSDAKVVCKTPFQCSQLLGEISPAVELCTMPQHSPGFANTLAPSPKKSTKRGTDASQVAQVYLMSAEAGNGINRWMSSPRHSPSGTSHGSRVVNMQRCSHEDRTKKCHNCHKVGVEHCACKPFKDHVCVSCYVASQHASPNHSSTPTKECLSKSGAATSGSDSTSCILFPKGAREQARKRAHLLSSIGDIERSFRMGTFCTKSAQLTPIPTSALPNIDLFVARAQVYLRSRCRSHPNSSPTDAARAMAAEQLLHNGHLMRCLMHEVLSQWHPLGHLPGEPKKEGQKLASSPPEGNVVLTEEFLEVMREVLRDAVVERYRLYRPVVGLCPFQESFLSILYRDAFDSGDTHVLLQLENCMMRLVDSPTEPLSSVVSLSKAQPQESVPSDAEYAGNCVTSTQSFVFHHFDGASTSRCCCGAHTRDTLLSARTPKLSLSQPDIAFREDLLLLLLLHRTFGSGRTKQKVELLEPSVFISSDITAGVAKSIAASALRISVLPLQFALPRWVYFIIHEARFLMPLALRERMTRFLAYGARRSLAVHMRKFRVHRPERSFAVHPAECSRLSNEKYRVDRSRFVHDALRVLQTSADARLRISIEFKGDAGVGQGPTAHFFTLIAKEVSRVHFQLWRNTHTPPSQESPLLPVQPSLTGRATCRPLTRSRCTGWNTTPAKPHVTKPIGVIESATARGVCGPPVTWRGVKKEMQNSAIIGEDQMVVPPPEGLYPQFHSDDLHPKSSLGRSCTVRDDRITFRHPPIDVLEYFDRHGERAQMYYLVGAALGRAFLDGQVLPLHLSTALAVFLRRPRFPLYTATDASLYSEGHGPATMGQFLQLPEEAVRHVDRTVAKSLETLRTLDAASLEALDMPFTLPGDDAYELVAGGKDIIVRSENLSQYCNAVTNALLYDTVAHPLYFMMMGCRDVVPTEAFALLNEEELMRQLCGEEKGEDQPLWTVEEIRSVLVANHGYHNDSPQVGMLANVLGSKLTPKEQRCFLLFATGCPRLPIGGICALGAITVVMQCNDFFMRRGRSSATHNGGDVDEDEDSADLAHQRHENPMSSDMDLMSSSLTSVSHTMSHGNRNGVEPLMFEIKSEMEESDWPLPSVNTCFRYLKLPPYPSEDLMYKKLLKSITHTGDTFELS